MIDRHLMNNSVPKSDIQILYIGALRLATKMTELNPIRGITSSSFTKADLIDMENVLLKEFDYNIAKFATIANFIRRYQVDDATMQVANYYAELSLLYVESYDYLPSEIAAASIHLACKSFGKESKNSARLDICSYLSKCKPKPTLSKKYNRD